MKRRAALALPWLLGPALGLAQAPEGRAYTPGPFDSIEISGAAAVRFTQGEVDEVFVEGGPEVQRAVDLEVRNGQLVIRSGGGWKFWNAQRTQVQVTARDLRRLSISGAADLVATLPVQVRQLAVSISGAGLARFDQLRADKLSFSVSGAGDGQMAGSVQQLDISVSGRGAFRGEQLMSERATVQVSGVGDVRLWVQEALSVSVSGIGTVDYWGAPRVSRRTSGIAKVNDHGPKAAP
jgi:Putative auto-transporter adhesin, head GIN domain